MVIAAIPPVEEPGQKSVASAKNVKYFHPFPPTNDEIVNMRGYVAVDNCAAFGTQFQDDDAVRHSPDILQRFDCIHTATGYVNFLFGPHNIVDLRKHFLDCSCRVAGRDESIFPFTQAGPPLPEFSSSPW